MLREDANGLADSGFAEKLFLFVREFEFAEGEAEFVEGELAAGEFTTGGFRSVEFVDEAGAEFAVDFAAFVEFEEGDGLVLDGAKDLDERRIRRGTKMIARMTAAVVLTRKSLLERGRGFGEITRRGLPIVALTCGSDVTGIGAREGCGATL